MSGFLTGMRATSEARLRQARALTPLDAVVQAAQRMPRPCPLRPDAQGFDLIAEIKKSSPSAGELSPESDNDLTGRAVAYAGAGAIAVSVLTEPTCFGGNLEHLRAIAAALRPLGVPAMRKDFLVGPYQVWEAAAAGAGGVLLIIRLLDDETIMRMLDAAGRCRMFVLLEAFDADDLRRATPFVRVYQDILVGLNTRDLQTLEVDLERLGNLADRFPADCLRVAESGISQPADAAAVARAGYQLALVGTALMRSNQPRELISSLLAAGREAAQS